MPNRMPLEYSTYVSESALKFGITVVILTAREQNSKGLAMPEPCNEGSSCLS